MKQFLAALAIILTVAFTAPAFVVHNADAATKAEKKAKKAAKKAKRKAARQARIAAKKAAQQQGGFPTGTTTTEGDTITTGAIPKGGIVLDNGYQKFTWIPPQDGVFTVAQAGLNKLLKVTGCDGKPVAYRIGTDENGNKTISVPKYTDSFNGTPQTETMALTLSQKQTKYDPIAPEFTPWGFEYKNCPPAPPGVVAGQQCPPYVLNSLKTAYVANNDAVCAALNNFQALDPFQQWQQIDAQQKQLDSCTSTANAYNYQFGGNQGASFYVQNCQPILTSLNQKKGFVATVANWQQMVDEYQQIVAWQSQMNAFVGQNSQIQNQINGYAPGIEQMNGILTNTNNSIASLYTSTWLPTVNTLLSAGEKTKLDTLRGIWAKGTMASSAERAQAASLEQEAWYVNLEGQLPSGDSQLKSLYYDHLDVASMRKQTYTASIQAWEAERDFNNQQQGLLQEIINLKQKSFSDSLTTAEQQRLDQLVATMPNTMALNGQIVGLYNQIATLPSTIERARSDLQTLGDGKPYVDSELRVAEAIMMFQTHANLFPSATGSVPSFSESQIDAKIAELKEKFPTLAADFDSFGMKTCNTFNGVTSCYFSGTHQLATEAGDARWKMCMYGGVQETYPGFPCSGNILNTWATTQALTALNQYFSTTKSAATTREGERDTKIVNLNTQLTTALNQMQNIPQWQAQAAAKSTELQNMFGTAFSTGLTCVAPAYLNGAGDACLCPSGYTLWPTSDENTFGCVASHNNESTDF